MSRFNLADLGSAIETIKKGKPDLKVFPLDIAIFSERSAAATFMTGVILDPDAFFKFLEVAEPDKEWRTNYFTSIALLGDLTAYHILAKQLEIAINDYIRSRLYVPEERIDDAFQFIGHLRKLVLKWPHFYYVFAIYQKILWLIHTKPGLSFLKERFTEPIPEHLEKLRETLSAKVSEDARRPVYYALMPYWYEDDTKRRNVLEKLLTSLEHSVWGNEMPATLVIIYLRNIYGTTAMATQLLANHIRTFHYISTVLGYYAGMPSNTCKQYIPAKNWFKAIEGETLFARLLPVFVLMGGALKLSTDKFLDAHAIVLEALIKRFGSLTGFAKEVADPLYRDIYNWISSSFITALYNAIEEDADGNPAYTDTYVQALLAYKMLIERIAAKDSKDIRKWFFDYIVAGIARAHDDMYATPPEAAITPVQYAINDPELCRRAEEYSALFPYPKPPIDSDNSGNEG